VAQAWPRAAATPRWAAPLRRAAAALAIAGMVGVPLAIVAFVGLGLWAGIGGALLPGASHDGLPLAAAAKAVPSEVAVPVAGVVAAGDTAPAAVASGGLTVRRGCVWGQPGRLPYQGSTEQALRAAGLPPEVVREVAARRLAHQPSGRLEIRTGAIRTLDDQPRQFDPQSVALSFGHTMCLQSRVNFVAGHVEQADYYDVRDARGQRHTVMVPDVCGNVSVLGVRGERGVLGRLAQTLAQRSDDAARLALALSDVGALTDGDGGTPAPRGATADAGERGEAGEGAMTRPTTALPGVGSGAGAGGAGPGRTDAPAGNVATARSVGVPGGGVVVVGAAPVPLPGPVTQGAPAAAPGSSNGTGTGTGTGTGLPVTPSLPRQAAVVVLKTVSDQLARGSATVAGLAGGGSGGGGSGGGSSTAGQAVPEPGSALLLLTALAAMGWAGKRRR
jgi:hypothetical protein